MRTSIYGRLLGLSHYKVSFHLCCGDQSMTSKCQSCYMEILCTSKHPNSKPLILYSSIPAAEKGILWSWQQAWGQSMLSVFQVSSPGLHGSFYVQTLSVETDLLQKVTLAWFSLCRHKAVVYLHGLKCLSKWRTETLKEIMLILTLS